MTAVETNTRTHYPVHFRTARIDNQDFFYREGGPVKASPILLLHGFPTSSNMFRNLMPRLAGSFRLIAPDDPGYSLSSMPDHKSFSRMCDNYSKSVNQLAEQLDFAKHTLYLTDYGAPVGYGLELLHLEPGTGLIGRTATRTKRDCASSGIRSRNIGQTRKTRLP